MNSNSRGSTTLSATAVLVVLVLSTLAVPASAGDSNSCVRNGSTLEIDLFGTTEDDPTELVYVVTVESGSYDVAAFGTGGVAPDCGDATTSNVDTVDIDGGPDNETVGIYPLLAVPGQTSETGSTSETEFTVDLGGGTDMVGVNGSEAADVLAIGTKGININSDDDADVVIYNSVEIQVLGGGIGDDVLHGQGVLATGQATQVPVQFDGGPDDDSIYGGDAGDWINGGDGNDDMFGNAGNDHLGETIFPSLRRKEIGADVLVGGSGGDILHGGAGKDTLEGESGADEEFGGAGNDTFNQVTDTGGDLLFGGDDVDTATYAGRLTRVVVQLDLKANDGASGEGDRVGWAGDIENIVGGAANDDLIGNGGPNTINGGPGNDTLRGKGGADKLNGAGGSDDCIAGSDPLDAEANCEI